MFGNERQHLKGKRTALMDQHLRRTPECSTMASYSPIHTLMGVCCHARCCQPHWEQSRLHCPTQGHHDGLGWSRVGTANLLFAGQPTLPPEQQSRVMQSDWSESSPLHCPMGLGSCYRHSNFHHDSCVSCHVLLVSRGNSDAFAILGHTTHYMILYHPIVWHLHLTESHCIQYFASL